MQIVTLITDWSESSHYVAALKARLLSAVPRLTIVDISHNVQSFSTLQAAFILQHTYANFPPGTIHLVGVNSEPSPFNRLMITKINNHYFVAPNNGILSLALDNVPSMVTEMVIPAGSTGFKSLILFSRAVQAILTKSVDQIGHPAIMQRSLVSRPTYDDKIISGHVIYIDSFGNAITNIDRKLFETVCRNRNFEITIQSNHNQVDTLSNYYDDVAQGELMALFNSLQLLEIAINQGNLAQREGLDTASSVRIKFI